MMDDPRRDEDEATSTNPQQHAVESDHENIEDLPSPFAAEKPTLANRDVDQSPHTSQYPVPLDNEELQNSTGQQTLPDGFVPLDALPRFETLNIPDNPSEVANPPDALDDPPEVANQLPLEDNGEPNHGNREDLISLFTTEKPTPTDRDLDQSPHTSQYLAPLVNEERIEQQPLHSGFATLDTLPQFEILSIPDGPPRVANRLVSDPLASTETTEVAQTPIPSRLRLTPPPPTSPHTYSSGSSSDTLSTPISVTRQPIAYPSNVGISDPNIQYAYNPLPTAPARRFSAQTITPSPWSPSPSNYDLNTAHYNSFQYLGPAPWERSNLFSENLPAMPYQTQYPPFESVYPVPPMNPTSPRYSLATDFQRYGSTSYQSIPTSFGPPVPIGSYDEPFIPPLRPPSPTIFDGVSEWTVSSPAIPRMHESLRTPVIPPPSTTFDGGSEWTSRTPSFEDSESNSPRLRDYPVGLLLDSEDHPRSTPFTPGSTPWVPPPGFIPQTFQPSPTMQPGLLHPPIRDDYSDIEPEDLTVLDSKELPEEEKTIWKTYVDEATKQDKENITNWNQSIDVLLVFAGLFSAILTAFIIEFYKLMQQNPQQTAADLLLNITLTLQNATGTSGQLPASLLNAPVTEAEAFSVPSSVLVVNGLWFSSLALSLVSAMAAMLIKQWLQHYSMNLSGGSQSDYARRRQYRYNAFDNWRVPEIISALPMMMHLSVALFLIGLVVQLWQINSTIAELACSLIGSSLLCYLATLVLPLIYSACPYKSSVMALALEISHYIRLSMWKLLHAVLLVVEYMWPDWAIYLPLRQVHTCIEYARSSGTRNKEKEAIQSLQSDLELDGLVWLIEVSQMPGVTDLSLKTIQELRHSRNMIQQLIDRNVLERLVERAYVAIPAKDTDFWNLNRLPFGAHHAIFQQLSDAVVYMNSLMFIWHHPLYLSQKRPPVRTEGERYENYMPLFGDWLSFWRSLKTFYNHDVIAMGKNGWNLHTFAVLICAETYYCHLHPKCQPLHAQDITPANNTPYFDLLGMFFLASGSPATFCYLEDHTVTLCLDTLAWALSSMQTDSDVFARQDVLWLLLKLVESRYLRYNNPQPLQKLLVCLQMFDLSKRDRSELVQRDYSSLSTTELQLSFCHIFNVVVLQQQLYPLHAPINLFLSPLPSPPPLLASIVPLSSYLLFQTLMLQSTPTGEYDATFINLPSADAQALLERIVGPEFTIVFDTMEGYEWCLEMIIKWYHHSGFLPDGKKIVPALDRIPLQMLAHLDRSLWQDDAHARRVAAKIYPFVTQTMMDADTHRPGSAGLAEDVSIALSRLVLNNIRSDHTHTTPEGTLDQPTNRFLEDFIDLQGFDAVLEFLQSGKSTEFSFRQWASLAEEWTNYNASHLDAQLYPEVANKLYNTVVIVVPDDVDDEDGEDELLHDWEAGGGDDLTYSEDEEDIDGDDLDIMFLDIMAINAEESSTTLPRSVFDFDIPQVRDSPRPWTQEPEADWGGFIDISPPHELFQGPPD